MSLRDDLELILSEVEPSRYSHEAVTKFNDAALRLRAALTPAAEKWLEALPELLELEARATPGPWSLWTGCSWRRVGSDATGGEVITPTNHPIDGHPDLLFPNGGQSGPDARIVPMLRNALHEAAALHNAQDNKEQK